MIRFGLRPAVFVLMLLAMALPAAAHRPSSGGGGGISIPSLVHGQMEVHVRHWNTIINLAERHPGGDARFSRLLNYARIQRAWCFWGWMPTTISDEESPFNECSHAYLAAARALIETLREQGPPGSRAATLGNTIDRDLVLAGAPVLCGFSGEEFDTADHVSPHWREIPHHPPTLAVFAIGMAVLTAGAIWLFRMLRVRPR